jgi:hypothetical protein
VRVRQPVVHRVAAVTRLPQDIIENCQYYDLHTFMDNVWNFDFAVELQPFQLR